MKRKSWRGRYAAPFVANPSWPIHRDAHSDVSLSEHDIWLAHCSRTPAHQRPPLLLFLYTVDIENEHNPPPPAPYWQDDNADLLEEYKRDAPEEGDHSEAEEDNGPEESDTPKKAGAMASVRHFSLHSSCLRRSCRV